MKKIIILLFICCGLTKVKAQPFTKYADTANYLIHQIENKKSLFVGKPLSVLLDNLKIQPVDAISAYSRNEADFGKSLYLDFNREQEASKEHFVIVEFSTVPPYNQLFPIFFPIGGGRGNVQSIIAVYKALIVKDVLVKDYTDDEPLNPDVHY